MVANRTQNGLPLNRWQQQMESFFDEVLSPQNWQGNSPFNVPRFPLVNLWEDDDNLYAEAELPGFSLDDLEIYVLGEELTIKGERKVSDEEDVKVHRRERVRGKFERVFRLPTSVSADEVKAVLANGVLTLTLPKTPEAKPRKINITQE
ncbi:Molecular chaperone [Planctomycetales bacterium 10988]|nr:Molecular chaperone [Planctomycetales bacterium 10988]